MKKKAKQAGNIGFTFVAYFGGYVCNIIYIALFQSVKAIGRFFRVLWRATRGFRSGFVNVLKYLYILVSTPFYKMKNYIMNVKREIAEAKADQNGEKPSKIRMRHISNVLFGKHGIVITLFNYAAPVISIFFLFSIVTYATSTFYAVKLNVNGKFIGYIESEQVYNDAEEVIQQRINYAGSDMNISFTPAFSVQQIGYSDTLTKYQVADLMLQNSGVNLVYAYGFYINDVFYGALENYHNVQGTLDELLGNYRTDNPTETVAFVDNISYDKAGLFTEDSLIDEKWLIDLISSTKVVADYYEVEYGDSHTLIGDKLDLTQAELDALNPGFTESDLHVGDLIKRNAEIPFLSVSVTKTIEYDQNVDYDVEYYDDSSLYVGTPRTTTEGEYGTDHVVADVTYVNGKETNRIVKSTARVSDPVSQEVAIGTKPTPAGSFSGATAAYGKFIWPVKGGYISERVWWKGGYSGHSGLDIAGISYGQPVYAGASGVVTLSSWYYGYGYCVMIYHPDLGLTTLYGHNSQLYVYVGQEVSQGECIAAAGSTGQSTGVHCHFEVRSGNTCLDPEDYLS